MPSSLKFFLAFIFLALQALPVSASSNTVVNLSHYDLMRPDFGAMRSEGIVGIIHEASYPRYVRDAKYAERQGAAVRAGLLWGAYHFADATSPVRQADHLLEVVSSSWRQAGAGSRPEQVLLVLDFEKNGHYPGGTMRPDQAAAFVEKIRARTGKYPGLYGGENRLREVLGHSGISSADRESLGRCWLWVANYHREPSAMPPWVHWSMWQYTGDGVCDLPRRAYPKGIANVRHAERNIFRGSASDLRIFWETHGWRPGGDAGE